MIHKVLFRRFVLGSYFLGFSALLFGLTRYSYLARELLVCWLFFCSLFAVLALALFAAVLAGFAGQHLLKLLSVAKLVIPDLAATLVAAPPPLLAAAAFKRPAGPCRPVFTLDSASFLLVESTPFLLEEPHSEMDVQNWTDIVLYTSYSLSTSGKNVTDVPRSST